MSKWKDLVGLKPCQEMNLGFPHFLRVSHYYNLQKDQEREKCKAMRPSYVYFLFFIPLPNYEV